jgi:mannose-6-phosphate isomerase-like protein (cupin superfamily)
MNLRNEAERLEKYWTPRVVGRINDQFVKVAKLKGELAWHKHDHEDEMFLVLKGQLRIEYEHREPVQLQAGDFHIVPRNVMHNPVCEEECLVALVEPATTKHTGELVIDRTVAIEDQLKSDPYG